jgi:hypothetical protein
MLYDYCSDYNLQISSKNNVPHGLNNIHVFLVQTLQPVISDRALGNVLLNTNEIQEMLNEIYLECVSI